MGSNYSRKEFRGVMLSTLKLLGVDHPLTSLKKGGVVGEEALSFIGGYFHLGSRYRSTVNKTDFAQSASIYQGNINFFLLVLLLNISPPLNC